MEPINELSMNLTTLLQEMAEKRCDLNIHGQKFLLDALRKLLIATEKLDVQLQAMTRDRPDAAPPSRPRRPVLYLVD
ncbi:hypothetical protein [Pseudomonas abietaniphila]|uniref:hypothetical protein n=1 Tax=Pseudomonas abietaniphila TaxID=89065 RepID=UPI0007824819|nr:hypothetical protein [Pseudomonas abietaniphila]